MPDMVSLAYMGLSAVAAALGTCAACFWWHQRSRALWAKQLARLRGERDQSKEQLREAKKQVGLLKVTLAAHPPAPVLDIAPALKKAAAPLWFDVPAGDSREQPLIPVDGFAETMPFTPNDSRVH